MDITKSSLINCSSSVDDTAIINKKFTFNIFDDEMSMGREMDEVENNCATHRHTSFSEFALIC